MVLEHVGSAQAIVHKLASACRPGGWLVVEELDKVSAQATGAGAALTEVRSALADVMRTDGFDPYVGRELPRLLGVAGLHGISAEGRALVTCGTDDRHGQREMYARLIVQLRLRLLMRGVADSQIALALEQLWDPELVMIGSLLISASGKRSEPRRIGGLAE